MDSTIPTSSSDETVSEFDSSTMPQEVRNTRTTRDRDDALTKDGEFLTSYLVLVWIYLRTTKLVTDSRLGECYERALKTSPSTTQSRRNLDAVCMIREALGKHDLASFATVITAQLGSDLWKTEGPLTLREVESWSRFFATRNTRIEWSDRETEVFRMLNRDHGTVSPVMAILEHFVGMFLLLGLVTFFSSVYQLFIG